MAKQPHSKAIEPPRGASVHKELERLGIRTDNDETSTTRPKFKDAAVSRMYREELCYLFDVFCCDEGSVLTRDDPQLFDTELNSLLEEFGPLVWPVPDGDNRDHLRQPQAESLYKEELVYPRDATILKERLRALLLSKRRTPRVNYETHIAEKHKDSHLRAAREATIAKSSAALDGYESEDSVIGTTMQSRVVPKILRPHTSYSSVELRLYRITNDSLPGAIGGIIPYDGMFLSNQCPSAEDCFKRICEHIGTDCSFVIFHLPEHMSTEGSVRIDRGAPVGEEKFQRVLDYFQKAEKFPGEPQYHSVEVEVGLDLPVEG